MSGEITGVRCNQTPKRNAYCTNYGLLSLNCTIGGFYYRVFVGRMEPRTVYK